VEKVIVVEEVVIYFAKLWKGAQTCGQHFYIFEGHPVLVKLLVHPVHIRYNAFALYNKKTVLLL